MTYDSNLGTFLQRDPVEEGTNLYEYVDDSPTDALDPLGLQVVTGPVSVTSIFTPASPGGVTWQDNPYLLPTGSPPPSLYEPSQGWGLNSFFEKPLPPQPAHGRFSQKGVDFLKSYETLRLCPYDDRNPSQPLTAWNDRATIGWGHLIGQREWARFSQGITKEEAEAVLAADIRDKGVSVIEKNVPARLSQQQYDALVVLAFNIGGTRFAGSTVRKILNDPRRGPADPRLEAAWKSWNKVTVRGQLVVSPGLVNRRLDEWEMYHDGDYRRDH